MIENIDKAFIFLIIGFMIIGFRFEINTPYDLAIGMCIGSSIYYFARTNK